MKIADLKLSAHLLTILDRERSNIRLEWIESAISDPDFTKEVSESEIRFWKRIPEFDGRFLRTVVDPKTKKIVTAFFDRRFKL